MNEGLRNFKNIFSEHYPWVFAKIRRIVNDRAIAEDLAQEVFLTLYEKPPDDLKKLKAWLHRVSTHVTYDYFRKQKNKQDTSFDEELFFSEKGPIDSVLADREWIQSVLNQLSPRDRRVLILQQEGYSYKEIARVLNVNPTVVGSIVSRAKERFKRISTSEVDENGS